mgnify:CR=1 FL=1
MEYVRRVDFAAIDRSGADERLNQPLGTVKTRIRLAMQRLRELRIEHRDLDDVICRLSLDIYVDELQLRRLKKRKLMLKDQILRLESELIPDLNA